MNAFSNATDLIKLYLEFQPWKNTKEFSFENIEKGQKTASTKFESQIDAKYSEGPESILSSGISGLQHPQKTFDDFNKDFESNIQQQTQG